MVKKGQSVNKRRPRRNERSRLLIVTEGENTEVQYFEGLVQYLRSSGTVRGVRYKGVGKDPLRVLRAAVDLNRRDPDGFDEVWVVVDVDDHATLEQALAEGGRLGVPVVVSNPCFEIWLVWHYEDCAAHQDAKQVLGKLGKYGHVGKSIPNSFPYDAHGRAAERAGDSVGPWELGPNPSSAVPHLTAALQRRP